MGPVPPPSNNGRYHVPVMAGEVVEIFRPVPAGVIIDATFGGGGHSRALLEHLEQVSILAIDRDPDAVPSAVPKRLRFVSAAFGDLAQVASSVHPEDGWPDDEHPHHIVGVLFDLGVSSHQLETAGRGFSYRLQGPLDMRMDPRSTPSAGEIVNSWARDDLARVLRRYGEERFARRIAAAIVAQRPIDDTEELAKVVASAVPAPARRRGHPARKTFQAIRIAVNGELDQLERGLDDAIGLVEPMGRVAVITYHSLEDRIVKRRFAAGTSACECPPGLPVCTCGKVTELRSLARGGITPSAAEVEGNARARSARLRAVEKVSS